MHEADLAGIAIGAAQGPTAGNDAKAHAFAKIEGQEVAHPRAGSEQRLGQGGGIGVIVQMNRHIQHRLQGRNRVRPGPGGGPAQPRAAAQGTERTRRDHADPGKRRGNILAQRLGPGGQQGQHRGWRGIRDPEPTGGAQAAGKVHHHPMHPVLRQLIADRDRPAGIDRIARARLAATLALGAECADPAIGQQRIDEIADGLRRHPKRQGQLAPAHRPLRPQKIHQPPGIASAARPDGALLGIG